jgi:hypothetical protein
MEDSYLWIPVRSACGFTQLTYKFILVNFIGFLSEDQKSDRVFDFM